jgi:ribosomal protein S18 acetylase RimI-like enzyme
MIRISLANTREDLQEVRRLFLEYQSSLGISLDFQQFDTELATLPGDYAQPDGCLLIALYEEQVVGCAALRRLDVGICEMKRLYVRPQYRGKKIGKLLTEYVIDYARGNGYRRMRLDTLPNLDKALALYNSLGFKRIAAYRHYELDAIFMEIRLS